MQMHILLVLFAKISVATVPVKYIVLFLVLLSLYLTDVLTCVCRWLSGTRQMEQGHVYSGNKKVLGFLLSRLICIN